MKIKERVTNYRMTNVRHGRRIIGRLSGGRVVTLRDALAVQTASALSCWYNRYGDYGNDEWMLNASDLEILELWKKYCETVK